MYKEKIESAQKEETNYDTPNVLASLDDEIVLRQDTSNTPWNVGSNWKNLFVRLAPELMQHPSDFIAKRKVNEILRTIKKDRDKMPNEHDEDTVKIHFMALGLISVEYTKTIQGSMGLFWSLTKKGKQLMFELISVKKNK